MHMKGKYNISSVSANQDKKVTNSSRKIVFLFLRQYQQKILINKGKGISRGMY